MDKGKKINISITTEEFEKLLTDFFTKVVEKGHLYNDGRHILNKVDNKIKNCYSSLEKRVSKIEEMSEKKATKQQFAWVSLVGLVLFIFLLGLMSYSYTQIIIHSNSGFSKLYKKIDDENEELYTVLKDGLEIELNNIKE